MADGFEPERPTDATSTEETAHDVPFREAFWVWVRVAAYSFGGPAGQIGVMHELLVERKRWIDERRFLHAMNYTMLLPGPEAQQLATYVGWLLHRTKGGLVAGALFILPGFVSILALSVLYAEFRELTAVEAVFFGLQAAVLAIVVRAVIRIGRRTLANSVMVAIAAGAFVGIFVFDVPFPLIILGAALLGFVATASRRRRSPSSPATTSRRTGSPTPSSPALSRARPSGRRPAARSASPGSG